MSSRQIFEVLEFSQHIYKKVCEKFNAEARRSDDFRYQSVLEHLTEREHRMQHILETMSHTQREKLLNTFVRNYPTEPDVRLTQLLNQLEHASVTECVAILIEIKRNLVLIYEQITSDLNLPGAVEFMKSLLDYERTQLQELSQQYGELEMGY